MKKILGIITGVVAMFLFVLPVFAKGGFDEYGYNYTARIFNGTGESWSEAKGLPADYLGVYAPDKLVMKWNAEWDRGNDENWTNPPYAAWENNEWNGKFPGGSGENWHYKIVWVGPQVWDISGNYTFYIHFSGNDYNYNVDLVQNGNVVTGTLTDTYLPAQYNHDLTVTGSVSGDSITLEVVYPGPYWGTRTFDGSIDTNGVLSGTWSDTGTGNGSGSWSTTSGAAAEAGPYWVEGGYRIWDQFEVIMDQGIDPNVGPGHIWFAHAIPTGYGNVVK